MNFFLLFLLFSLSSYAAPECNVFVPKKTYDFKGNVITLDFLKVLETKKYAEVSVPEEAHYLLHADAKERKVRKSHFVDASVKLIDKNFKEIIRIEKTVLCSGKPCSADDFATAFRKSYNKLDHKLGHCQSFFVGILK